jgi:hypothetical protein
MKLIRISIKDPFIFTYNSTKMVNNSSHMAANGNELHRSRAAARRGAAKRSSQNPQLPRGADSATLV